MRTLIAFLLLTSAAQADCQTIGQAARKIMLMRQSGVTLSKAMPKPDELAPEAYKLARAMVLAAWEVPHYATLSYQRRALDDFQNRYELICYKQGG